MVPSLAMSDLKQFRFCPFSLSKKAPFHVSFLALPDLKQARFCPFSLSKKAL